MKPLLSHILLHGIDEQTPVEQLELALQEHPYSPTLAVLLTKAYTERNDVRFEHMLSRSALLTQERKNLHAFVHQMMQAEPEVLAAPEAVRPQETTLEEVEEASASTADPKQSEQLTPQTPDASQAEEMLEASAEPKEDSASESEETAEREEASGISRDPDELLTQQYLSEALSSGVLAELYNEEQAETGEEEEASIEDPKADAEQEATSNESSSAEAPEHETIQPETSAPEKLGFSAWMSFLSDEETSSTDIPEQPTEKEQTTPEQQHPDDSITPPKPAEPRKPREDLSSIIDRFIEQEDEIVPKRASFFSPAKAAKASLEDNDSIVTETLARIYAEQGNVSKAIDTYEKLRLLHPEKSSYFAALIQNLKSD